MYTGSCWVGLLLPSERRLLRENGKQASVTPFLFVYFDFDFGFDFSLI